MNKNFEYLTEYLDCGTEDESCCRQEEGEDAWTDEDPGQDFEIGVYHVQLIHVVVELKEVK